MDGQIWRKKNNKRSKIESSWALTFIRNSVRGVLDFIFFSTFNLFIWSACFRLTCFRILLDDVSAARSNAPSGPHIRQLQNHKKGQTKNESVKIPHNKFTWIWIFFCLPHNYRIFFFSNNFKIIAIINMWSLRLGWRIFMVVVGWMLQNNFHITIVRHDVCSV